jgi:hypothetical protein
MIDFVRAFHKIWIQGIYSYLNLAVYSIVELGIDKNVIGCVL